MTNAKFDPWAAEYDGWFKTPRGAVVLELEKDLIMELAQPTRGEKALDVGCGTGNFTLELLERGVEVIGLDASSNMLRVAQEKVAHSGHGAGLYHGVMESIPFPAEQFDLVLCISALESSPAPREAVGELWRVVKPGGRLVVAVLNDASPWADRRKQRADGSVWEGQHFYQADEFIALLAQVTGQRAEDITWNGSVFFGPQPTPDQLDAAWELEREGRAKQREKAALLAARVNKPQNTA